MKFALTKILATVKTIDHFNHTVVLLGYISETVCIRHLLGSWPRLLTILGTFTRSLYNCVVMEIFMPLMATGDSLTDV